MPNDEQDKITQGASEDADMPLYATEAQKFAFRCRRLARSVNFSSGGFVVKIAGDVINRLNDAADWIDKLECELAARTSAPSPEVKQEAGEINPLVAALTEIANLEPKPFDFPADWQEQIKACKECERWKDHPIQLGICDEHRRPLWAREKHDKSEVAALGYRAMTIAREALQCAASAPIPEPSEPQTFEEWWGGLAIINESISMSSAEDLARFAFAAGRRSRP